MRKLNSLRCYRQRKTPEEAYEICYRMNDIYRKGKSSGKKERKKKKGRSYVIKIYQKLSHLQSTRQNDNPMCAFPSCVCYVLAHSLRCFWKTSDHVKSQCFDVPDCLILW